MSFVFALLFAPDVGRLGHPDFVTRERAEWALSTLGIWALPFTAEGLTHTSPEVRQRCARLTAKYRSFAADLKAAAVLLGPWEPDPWALWHDEDGRHRLRRVAVGAGCSHWAADQITPDASSCWWYPPHEVCASGLRECRRQPGVTPSWFSPW